MEYTVDGETYKIREQMTYHITKVYKIGRLPIGFQSSAAIQNSEVGENVRVKYNPNKPKKGYLLDNNGHHFT